MERAHALEAAQARRQAQAENSRLVKQVAGLEEIANRVGSASAALAQHQAALSQASMDKQSAQMQVERLEIPAGRAGTGACRSAAQRA